MNIGVDLVMKKSVQAKERAPFWFWLYSCLPFLCMSNGWLVWHIRDELEIICRYILLISRGVK
jgi:hypothetical protein